jgi:hypothetical protein
MQISTLLFSRAGSAPVAALPTKNMQANRNTDLLAKIRVARIDDCLWWPSCEGRSPSTVGGLHSGDDSFAMSFLPAPAHVLAEYLG